MKWVSDLPRYIHYPFCADFPFAYLISWQFCFAYVVYLLLFMYHIVFSCDWIISAWKWLSIYFPMWLWVSQFANLVSAISSMWRAYNTVHPKKYAHSSCFVVFCCDLVSFSNIFRVTSLALGQSYDCPSASEATLKNNGKWIRSPQEGWYMYNQNKTVCLFYGIYCICVFVCVVGLGNVCFDWWVFFICCLL